MSDFTLINIEDIIREQVVADKCDNCERDFHWFLSCGAPVCPHCLCQLIRGWEEVKELRKRTVERFI
jgi:hypothetical protein